VKGRCNRRNGSAETQERERSNGVPRVVKFRQKPAETVQNVQAGAVAGEARNLHRRQAAER